MNCTKCHKNHRDAFYCLIVCTLKKSKKKKILLFFQVVYFCIIFIDYHQTSLRVFKPDDLLFLPDEQ